MAKNKSVKGSLVGPVKAKKIGLLGNMNNNNFAIMRYLRDLGLDAHLLLLSNDGKGSLSHFSAEADTTNIKKWRPFIKRLSLSNHEISALPFWWGILYFCLSPLRSVAYFMLRRNLPITTRKIEEELADYDVLIGSGVIPAVLERTNRKLDIFYPYSTGIEFYGSNEFLAQMSKMSPIRRYFWSKVALAQASGLQNTISCLNSELGLTADNFSALNVPFKTLTVPLFYNKEPVLVGENSPSLSALIETCDRFDFVVMSHCRHMWVKQPYYSQDQWDQENKRNDWLIKGFAEFRKRCPVIKSALLLFDYGPDAKASRELISHLSLDEHVIWSGTRPRKEIMQIIAACDVGVGEFVKAQNTPWGSTGWEVMAAGKPLLQTVNYTKASFKKQFKADLPDICDIQTKEDIVTYLVSLSHDKEYAQALGKSLQSWFDKQGGIGSARQWAVHISTL